VKPTSTRTLIVGLVVYAVVFVLLGVLVDRLLYLGLLGLAFARPVLREFQTLEDRDERQMHASYRSSHIAFLVAMLIAGIVVVKVGVLDGEEPPQHALLILTVAGFVKFAMLQVHSRARHLAGRLVAYVTGGAWLLFVLASHGFSPMSLVEGLPFLAVIGSAVASRFWPKVAGGIILLAGLATLWFFVIASNRGFGQQYSVLLLLPLPLVFSGVLLLLPEGGSDDAHVEEAVDDAA